jgi:hypothetical protein
MRKVLMFLIPLGLLALIGLNAPAAHAWCTPQILHCGDVIDSNTVQGHDDVTYFNCSGSIHWNGKAHVYKFHHPGDSLWITLDWTGTDTIAVFLLSDCDANHCLAYGLHQIVKKKSAGDYWIVVDSRRDVGTDYILKVFCGDHRLPVELLSFNAQDTESGIRLNWSTASETDNSRFRIERQLEDRDDWNVVAVVAGQGQSTTQSNYTYLDETAQSGTTYAYRLLSESSTGEVDELQLVVVTHAAPATVETPTSFRLLSNYPNPFNPTTRISFEVPEQAQLALRVFDITGHLVTTLADGVYEAGTHEATFDGAGLPSGVYFAQLTGPASVQMIKMVLLK